MNCKKANEIMMVYLDSPLDVNIRKTAKLHKHIQKCGSCREDFNAYDEIMTNLQFINNPVVSPPDIETCVMSKILLLETVEKSRKAAKDNVAFIFWGVVSALLGLGFVFALSNDSSSVMGYSETVSTQLGNFISDITVLFNQYQYILILAVIGLVFIQSRFSELINHRSR